MLTLLSKCTPWEGEASYGDSIAGATKSNYIVAYSRQRGKDFMKLYGVLKHCKNGCTMSYSEIRDISKLVKKEYPISASYFWMWKMFQIGFAYGKAEERKRRK